MKKTIPPTRIRFFALLTMTALIASCGQSESVVRKSNVKVCADETWSNCEIDLTGTLTIGCGATLTLENVILNMNPEVEDGDGIIVNASSLIVNNSTIKSSSGKQWNLEAHGASTLSFTDSTATDHAGIRAHGDTLLMVDHCELEEIQCHDDAELNVENGSGVYIVLFFTDAGAVSLTDGELASGDNLTRSFSFKSGAATTGTVAISASDVWGFQLDIEGNTDLSIEDGSEIVLALHLENAGTVTNNQNITSSAPQSGEVDFSGAGGPRFAFTNSRIAYINTYVFGATSNVTFSGTVRVVEANVWDGAALTFQSGTTLLADLAQAYDTATLNLNGVTLAADYSFPSITAEGDSHIYITDVNAIPGTRVYSVGDGKVDIQGGTGWVGSMFDSENPGNITYDPS